MARELFTRSESIKKKCNEWMSGTIISTGTQNGQELTLVNQLPKVIVGGCSLRLIQRINTPTSLLSGPNRHFVFMFLDA